MERHARPQDDIWFARQLEIVIANNLDVIAKAVGDFINDFIRERSDVKGSTATVWGHTRRNLIEFFGPNTPLREVTPGDADEFRLYLIESTAHKETPVLQGSASGRDYLHESQVDAAGLEQPASFTGETAIADTSAAKSAAFRRESESDLAIVIDAWPKLSAEVRSTIVGAAKGNQAHDIRGRQVL